MLNFNLPPTEWVHLWNIILIAIIPGPKSPQHISSFLCPLIEECKQLAAGIHIYDVQHDECFDLHIYLISAHADMPAAKHLVELKGPNTYSPCHTCEITSVQGDGSSVYYVPLTQPKAHGTIGLGWDPRDLPMHSQEHYESMLKDISAQTMK